MKHKNILFPYLPIFIFFISALTGCGKNKTPPYIPPVDTTRGNDFTKQNILILLADDFGYEVPTCNGGESYSTPAIDNLAKTGRRFTQCHSAPICSPSRFMLFTGKYNFRNYFLWGKMDRSNKTFANMLHDAGYITGYAGKWQLDGGDTSIHNFGWDKYSIWLPYYVDREEEYGIRYKGAQIYQGGAYLPASQTDNKFSEDEFTDYILSFIDSASSTNKPFLAFYSMMLPHTPFSPTPDDAEYATWDFVNGKSNTKYFANMVKYEDKKIGQIIDHLRQKDLLKNTLIIFSGDNGTSSNITSRFNGFDVTGGKSYTTEPGTNVPLIAVWQGKILANTISNTIIDFTDFLPTLADVAEISNPANYGILDGQSFYRALLSNGDTSIRNSLFDSYALNRYETEPYYTRWVQNDFYKLYDSGAFVQSKQFIKLEQCKPDGTPLVDANLTAEEQAVKASFEQTLKQYR